MASKATDPLRMPEGVEPPETTSAVKIPGNPDGQGGAKRSSDGCLAEPPQFYGDTTEAVEAGLPARPDAGAGEGSSGQGSGPLTGASRLTLDVVAFLTAPALLALAALIAIAIPAHRAARADPMQALKSE